MKHVAACEAAAGELAASSGRSSPSPPEHPAAATTFQPVREAHAAWLRTQPQTFLEVDDLTRPAPTATHARDDAAGARQETL